MVATGFVRLLTCYCGALDTSKFSQRRMQMDERVLREQDPEIYKPTSELCAAEGGTVGEKSTAVQE